MQKYYFHIQSVISKTVVIAVWGDFQNAYKSFENGLDVLTASKHEKSQVLLTQGLFKVA